MKTTGERIKLARITAGMRQMDLAKALGVAQSLISIWENDTQVPITKNLVRIANACGVAVDQLIDMSETGSRRQMEIADRISHLPEEDLLVLEKILAALEAANTGKRGNATAS